MQQPNAFKVLRILHTALLLGMIMFNIVALIVVQKMRLAADESLQRALQVACILVSAASLIAGFNIFKKKMLAARNDPGPGEQRMDLYRAACILWWALIEAPGLLAVAGFMLTHNYAFLALSLFHVACLWVFTPRKANIIVLLSLNADEVARLEGAGK
jgi:hypothetical protein